MLGSSLLQTGIPQSWSYFSSYENTRDMVLGNYYFRVVEPALDHPPLFALIPGTVSTVRGLSWDELPSLKAIRLPLVLLAALNLTLFTFWMYLTHGKSTKTVVAVALFATVPSIVFLSRLVVSENMLVSWFLTSLLGLYYRERWWGRGLLLLSLAAMPLTKISGLALAVGFIVGSLQMVKMRETVQMIAAVMYGTLLLLLYVSFFDLPLFLSVQLGQSARDVGFFTLYLTQLSIPALVERLSTDMWMWLGYIGVFAALIFGTGTLESKNQRTTLWRQLMAIVFMANLAFLLLSTGEHTVHGWYRILFVPLFAYFWGEVADHVWHSVQWFGGAVVMLLLIFVPRNLIRNLTEPGVFWQVQTFLARLWVSFSGLFVLAAVLQPFWQRPLFWQKIWRAALVCLFVIVILSNIGTVLTVSQERYWEDALFIETGTRS